jgi:hypothetical protein
MPFKSVNNRSHDKEITEENGKKWPIPHLKSHEAAGIEATNDDHYIM